MRDDLPGNAATGFRSSLEAQTREEVLDGATSFYRGRGLDLEPTGPLEVHDDPSTGEVRVVERYRVASFWDDGSRDISPWSLGRDLPVPDVHRPDGAPLALPFPMHARHHVEVRLPASDVDGWSIAPVRGEELRAGPIVVTRNVEVGGRRVAVTVEARSESDHVAASEVDRYRAEMERIDRSLGYELVEGSGAATGGSSGVALMLCFGVPLLLVVGVVVRRVGGAWWRGRRKRAFLRKQRVRLGEAPERPFDVDDLQEAKRAHRAVRCCSGECRDDGWSIARFGGDRVAVHGSVCDACGTRHRRYYRLRDDGAAADQGM